MGLCCTNRMEEVLLLTPDGFTYWLSEGYAKSSVAVEDGDTDLDLCDLPIEVPRHQRLAE